MMHASCHPLVFGEDLVFTTLFRNLQNMNKMFLSLWGCSTLAPPMSADSRWCCYGAFMLSCRCVWTRTLTKPEQVVVLVESGIQSHFLSWWHRCWILSCSVKMHIKGPSYVNFMSYVWINKTFNHDFYLCFFFLCVCACVSVLLIFSVFSLFLVILKLLSSAPQSCSSWSHLLSVVILLRCLHSNQPQSIYSFCLHSPTACHCHSLSSSPHVSVSSIKSVRFYLNSLCWSSLSLLELWG